MEAEDHPRNKFGLLSAHGPPLLLLSEASHTWWPQGSPRFRNDDDEEEDDTEVGEASQGFPAMWKAVVEDGTVLAAWFPVAQRIGGGGG